MTCPEDAFPVTPLTENELLLKNSEVIKIQGPDKKGRPILRIVGKYFPGMYPYHIILTIVIILDLIIMQTKLQPTSWKVIQLRRRSRGTCRSVFFQS